MLCPKGTFLFVFEKYWLDWPFVFLYTPLWILLAGWMPRCRSAWLSHGFCCDRKQTQSGLVVPADLIWATIEDKARGTAGTNWPALSFPMIFALPLLKNIRKKVFGYLHHIQQNEQDWWLEFFISIGWKRVAEFCFFCGLYILPLFDMFWKTSVFFLNHTLTMSS